jgi:integrase
MPAAGIEVRHARSCPAKRKGRCKCQPSYRASVWSKREQRLIRKSFATDHDAKNWHAEASKALRHGVIPRQSRVTLREAAAAFIDGARRGHVRNRNGERYKPSAIRGYERCLRLRVLPKLGSEPLGEIQRKDIQALVDKWLSEGLDPSTIKNTVNPLQAVYRHAVKREQVADNPTRGLELPRAEGRRDHVASPAGAVALLEALPMEDRALWATAFYAGLRRGELRALDWSAVDLAQGVIRVVRAWDDNEDAIALKTRAGNRDVPIAAPLRDCLVEHRMRTGGAGFVFGSTATAPFVPSTVRRRARAAWKAAKLEPIGLHECRHTFASLMIAAGVNVKALSTYMGHASVTITLDRYGHLFPGHEAEVVRSLDAYLARAAEPVREKVREADAAPERALAGDSGEGAA